MSAHLVYWLSVLLGGYRRETIFLAAAVLMTPLVVMAWRAGPAIFGSAAHGESARSGATAWPSRSPPVGGVRRADAGAAVASDRHRGERRPRTGATWGHLSIAQSLNAGNFLPQVPYFAGAPLVYHWFADFHAAIAAKAAGMFAIPAFVTSSPSWPARWRSWSTGWGDGCCAAVARRAAVLAAVLVIFGGGLAWMRLVGDVAAGYGDPISLVTPTRTTTAGTTRRAIRPGPTSASRR